jgi:hypothetical protein
VRNRYVAAFSTYLRPRWLLVLGVVTVWTLASLEVGGRVEVFPMMLVNMGLGCQIVLHLKEMIGSPRARVTPHSHSTHFVVAAAWLVVFAVIIPLAFSLARHGLFGPHLTYITLSLISFAIAGFFMTVPALPGWLSVLLWIALYEKLKISKLDISELVIGIPGPLSVIESLLLVVAATVFLTVTAERLTKFDAEAPSFDDRLLRRAGRFAAIGRYWAWVFAQKCGIAVRRFARHRHADQAIDVGTATYLQSIAHRPRSRLRRLGGPNPGPGENLLRRARHWDAAWRFAWKPVTFGVVAGGYLFWSALAASNARSLAWLWAIPFVPPGVLVTVASVSQRQTRGRLAIEYLRPFSRTQLVQSVALVVAGSVTLFVVLAVSIPLVGLWIHGGPWPNRQIVWFIVGVVAWAPLLLAVGIANIDSFDSTLNVGFFLSFYALYVLFLISENDSLGGWSFALVSALIFTFGLWTLIFACRTWLNNDVG